MTSPLPAYDAVVVGAGPAGSATATGIARDGFRVLLLEEHRDIGIPLHCSGLVTPRTLEEAGVGEGLTMNSIKRADIYAPSGRHLMLGDDRVRAYVIDRVALDRSLAAGAQEDGVEMRTEAKLVRAARTRGGISVTYLSRGKRYHVAAALLVGADGAHSKVARLMGMKGSAERVIGLGAEGTIPRANTDNVQVFVGSSMAPGWFAWTIPLGENRIRLGVGSSDGTFKPVRALQSVFETHARHFRDWRPIQWTGGVIPIWSRRTIVQDNVMLVGDAAGQVKPTSGGGIYPALVSARLAARVASKALAGGDLSQAALRAYEETWDKTFGQEFRRGEDLRRTYKIMTDDDFDRLLRLFGSRRILKLINKYGDIDYPGGLFQHLTRFAPALWMFARGPLKYAMLWK